MLARKLIGQAFTKPEYFWGRLSATAPIAYNAAASSGSNYGRCTRGCRLLRRPASRRSERWQSGRQIHRSTW